MVYQRKKRTYEPEPLQVPQVQNNLFASPDVETEDADTAYVAPEPTAAPSWDTLQRQIDNPSYDFGKISILPPDSAVQRQPVDPSTLSKREKFSQRFLSVQREPMVSSMSGPPGSLDRRFAAPQREDGQAALAPIAIQRQAETADQGTGAIAQSGGVNLTPKGSGRPLPKQVSDPFVQSGYPEVEQARVHVDDAATQSIQAKAYTQNNNIVVQSSGANDPKLLGHEATHVVQQSQMALKPDVNGTPINANPALEKNADDNGERVARNKPVNVEGAKPPTGINHQQNLQQPIQRAGIISVKGTKKPGKLIEYDEKGRDEELYRFAKKKGTKPPFKRITVEKLDFGKEAKHNMRKKKDALIKEYNEQQMAKENNTEIEKYENLTKEEQAKILEEWEGNDVAKKAYKTAKNKFNKYKRLSKHKTIHNKMILERTPYGTGQESKVGKNDNIDIFGHGNKAQIDGVPAARIAVEAAGAFELPDDWSGGIQIFACKFGVKGISLLAKSLREARKRDQDKDIPKPAAITNFQEIGGSAYNMVRDAGTGVSHPQSAILKVMQTYANNFLPGVLKEFNKWRKGGNIPPGYQELYEMLTKKNLGETMEKLLNHHATGIYLTEEKMNEEMIREELNRLLDQEKIKKVVKQLPTLEDIENEKDNRQGLFINILSIFKRLEMLLVSQSHLVAKSWRVIKKDEEKAKPAYPFGSDYLTQQPKNRNVESWKLGNDRKQDLATSYEAAMKIDLPKEPKKEPKVEEKSNETMRIPTTASSETDVTITEVDIQDEKVADDISNIPPVIGGMQAALEYGRARPNVYGPGADTYLPEE